MGVDISLIKRKAKERLANLQWGYVLLALVIVSAVTGVVSGIASAKTISAGDSKTTFSFFASFAELLSLLLGGIMSYGLATFMLKFVRNKSGKPDFEILFNGFRHIKESLIAVVLMDLIIGLGFAVFIVPGIIFSLSLSMTYYILNDNPGMSAWEAMKESRRIMNGNKMQLFMLYLSFILWWLLIIVTFGIATIYAAPYMATSLAYFYESIRPKRQEDEEGEVESDVRAEDLNAFSDFGNSDSDTSNDSDDYSANDADDDDTFDYFGSEGEDSKYSRDRNDDSDFF